MEEKKRHWFGAISRAAKLSLLSLAFIGMAASAPAVYAAPNAGLAEELAGARPRPNTLAFLRWKEDLYSAILDLCPIAAETNYYVDPSAGDDGDAGTEAAPFETLAKAQEMIDAWTPTTGRLGIRLKRGTTFEENVGLTLKSYVTVSTYGSGLRPLLNRFTSKFASGGTLWTLASGNRYTTTVASIGTIRRQTQRLKAIRKVASTAEVESTPNSWYWASNTLHLHLTNDAGTAVDPDTVALEYTLSASPGLTGILIPEGATRCRVDGVRCDGWGYSGFEDSGQNYGIKAACNDDEIAAITDFECYFNNRHCFGHNAGGSNSNAGGLVLFMNGRAGHAWAQDVTVGIAYAGGGEQETALKNIEIPWGAIADTAARDYAAGIAMYCHTNSSSTYHPGLVIVDGLYLPTPPHGYGCAAANHFGDLDEADSLDEVVAYEFNTRVEKFRGFGNGQCLWNNNAWHANRSIYLYPREDGQETLVNLSSASLSAGGWGCNDAIEVDLSNIAAARSQYALFNPTSPSANYSPKILFTHLKWSRNPQNLHTGICYDQIFGGATAAGAGSEFVNSIAEANRENPSTVSPIQRLTLVDSSSAIRNSAFLGMTPAGTAGTNGQESGANTVTLDGPLPLLAPQTVGIGQLYGAGEAAVCEYDFYGRPRSTSAPTIGPVEALDSQSVGPTAAEIAEQVVSQIQQYVAPDNRDLAPVDHLFQLKRSGDGTLRSTNPLYVHAGDMRRVGFNCDIPSLLPTGATLHLSGTPTTANADLTLDATGIDPKVAKLTVEVAEDAEVSEEAEDGSVTGSWIKTTITNSNGTGPIAIYGEVIIQEEP